MSARLVILAVMAGLASGPAIAQAQRPAQAPPAAAATAGPALPTIVQAADREIINRDFIYQAEGPVRFFICRRELCPQPVITTWTGVTSAPDTLDVLRGQTAQLLANMRQRIGPNVSVTEVAVEETRVGTVIVRTVIRNWSVDNNLAEVRVTRVIVGAQRAVSIVTAGPRTELAVGAADLFRDIIIRGIDNPALGL